MLVSTAFGCLIGEAFETLTGLVSESLKFSNYPDPFEFFRLSKGPLYGIKVG
jgi:hypothetical protein